MTRLVPVVVSIVLIAWLPQTARNELERLQGTWVVTEATGMQIPAGAHKAIVIKGDRYEGVTNGKTDERGTIKLNAATTPWSIDLIVSEGTGPLGTQLGLVELAGDSMIMALSETGQSVRPTGLSGDRITVTKIKPIDKTFDGTWEGAVGDAGQTLRLRVKLTNGPDGLATGTMVSVDQGGREAPIDAVLQMGSKLRLIIAPIRATYDGELKDGQLVGMWRQGRGGTALTLKRVNGAIASLPH
jgi:uncharacterized protein (TIGR03067 family)